MKKLILIVSLIDYCVWEATALYRYVPFGNVSEGMVYLDITTLVKQGSRYKCTVKNPYTMEFNFQFSYVLCEVEIDSYANRYRVLRTAFYDEKDKLLGQQLAESTDWQPIAHPSEIEGLLTILQTIEKDYPSTFNNNTLQDLLQPAQLQNLVANNRPDIYGGTNNYKEHILMTPHTQERYIYIGATPTKHKAYIDTSTVLYNSRTGIVKFQIRLVFDKESFKKELNKKQFKHIKKTLTKASYNTANYYIDLSKNQYAPIDSTYYSETDILATTEEICEYQAIIPGSFMDSVKEQPKRL